MSREELEAYARKQAAWALKQIFYMEAHWEHYKGTAPYGAAMGRLDAHLIFYCLSRFGEKDLYHHMQTVKQRLSLEVSLGRHDFKYGPSGEASF